MKKILVAISVLFIVKATYGQDYIITYLKGNVYHDHKLLKLHDKLGGTTQITSDDKNAELALFSPEKGKFRLSFVNSKPVAAGQVAKNSELYQLLVGNYLLTYTTEKTLTARGDFDLKTFFNPADTGGAGSHDLFLLEGEMLPVKSQSFKAAAGDKFFICTLKGKDTICRAITRNNSFLIFDDKTIAGLYGADGDSPRPLTCFVKHGYTFNGKYTEERFSGPDNIIFLPKPYAQSLVSAFQQGMGSYYQGNTGKLIADVDDQLSYYYGSSYGPAVSQILKSYLK